MSEQTKEKIFAIGDIHGQITMFEEMLSHWDEETEQLLLVGDLGDRGENPRKCFELARHLVEEKGAICLRGNHEEMLLMFLESPRLMATDYEMNGGGKTLQTLLEQDLSKADADEIAASVKGNFPWLVPFLESMPLLYEWQQYVFVHAGVNLRKENWRDSTPEDFVWIREGFYDQPNHTEKTFVFGHTVTAMLHGDNRNTDIWIDSDGKIGIDGGAVYGGSLHGVVFDKEGMIAHHEVKNTGFAHSEILRKG
jgi:serine/threonine protein phosphatase 1